MSDEKDLIAIGSKAKDELVLAGDPALGLHPRLLVLALFAASGVALWQAVTAATLVGFCATGLLARTALRGRTIVIDRARREVREELFRIPFLPPFRLRHAMRGDERCTIETIVVQSSSSGGARPYTPTPPTGQVTVYRVTLVMHDGTEVRLVTHDHLGQALNERDAVEAYLSGAAANPALHPAYTNPAMPTPVEQRGGGTGTCPVCGTDMNTGWVECPKCETPHHTSCWKYNGGCATYACRRSGSAR